MLEIMLLVLVLALVYAAKAVSIAMAADDAVEKSVSFSWVKPEVQDADAAPAWQSSAQSGPAAARISAPVRVYARRRPKAA